VRYYEDLREGEELESGIRQVSEAELCEFARQYDPQYFHTEPEVARDSIRTDLKVGVAFAASRDWSIVAVLPGELKSLSPT